MRPDGRQPGELRPITYTRDFTATSLASVLARSGGTTVLATVSVEEEVPRWMRGTRRGWVTAEYSMLPGSSPERIRRERRGPKGRTQEIERLIGRSLRAVCDLEALGERQVTVDCDVLEADGGTRTTSISAAYLALHDAFTRLQGDGLLAANPLTDHCAAVSVGIVGGVALLDLPYVEDAAAEVDMNVVMTGSGGLIEVQGTAEGTPFSRSELDTLIDLAASGISTIVGLQSGYLSEPPGKRPTQR